MNTLSDKLSVRSSDLALHEAIKSVIVFLGGSKIQSESGPTGAGTPAKEILKLYKFRKEYGYFKNELMIGLDETIECLARVEGDIHVTSIVIDNGFVGLWIDSRGSIVGIIAPKSVTQS